VAIARALAAEPALIVCDEPMSALDIGIQAQILVLPADLQGRLGTALPSLSRDWSVVQHLADRVLVFQDGRIVEQGSIVDVFGSGGPEG
jgi:peptide/nickel transport system ATP-binding protein